MACECSETSVLRERGLPIPLAHSCTYVKRRNVLVAKASRVASDRTAHIKAGDGREAAERAEYIGLMNGYVAEAWRTGLF